jgi:hypothetical protein
MRIVDNLAAIRLIWLLATPFEKFDAFKLGLIDANGNKLKKAETSEEKNATSMLHRLVWNLKKMIALVPGGKTRIGSLVAAYLLVREAEEKGYNEFQLEEEIVSKFQVLRSIRFIEEELLVERALNLLEDGAAAIVNVTGPATSTDQAAIRKPKKTFKDETKYKEGKTIRQVGIVQ